MDTFSPTFFILLAAGLAVVALLVNLKFKLPKKIFMVLAIIIVVFTAWFTLEDGLSKPSETSEQGGTRASSGISTTKSLIIASIDIDSDTTIPLAPQAVSAVNSLRFFIDVPENDPDFMKKISFSLLLKTGTELPSKAISELAGEKPKLVAWFIFDSPKPFDAIESLKIHYTGTPYRCQNPILLEIK